MTNTQREELLWMGPWSTDFAWPNPSLSTILTSFPFFFIVTIGDINFLSNTLAPLLSPLLESLDSTSYTSTSTLGQLTIFLLARLTCKGGFSQVAVGGQICWQPDRLTHSGHCCFAHSFPPHCIHAEEGATDPLKPLHWPTIIRVAWNIGPQATQKQKTIPNKY